MNRTDRLLAIMLHLQTRRYTRGEDLAERFEVGVRTIYRDVQALCEAGVPVVSTPGYGYTLMPGYFLPPLMLTPEEAGAILLGAAFVGEQVDAPYRQAVETARRKIEKILPEATRDEVEFLQDSLRFVGRIGVPDPTIEGRLSVVRGAILKRRVLRLVYHARRGEPAARDVEPHGLVSVGGRWVLAAYCRARAGMRHFRLDRIDDVAPTGERFARRREYTVRRVAPMEQGPEEVRVLFAPEAARWAREDRPLGFVGEEAHPDSGGVVMTFRPRAPRDLLPWLLSWGSAAQVLSPPELRRQLADEARMTYDLYQGDLGKQGAVAMEQAEGQQAVAVTESVSPSSRTMSIDGALPGDKRLAQPVLVVVERDGDEVVVTEPRFYIHASGATEAEAIEAFRRIFAGYLPFLEKQEGRLSAHLLEQLDYLRSAIVPA